jgi:hypothetical protein
VREETSVWRGAHICITREEIVSSKGKVVSGEEDCLVT